MKLQKLGNNIFKLIRELPSNTERVKQPPNVQTVVFRRVDENVHVIRGNLFMSNLDINNEFIKH